MNKGRQGSIGLWLALLGILALGGFPGCGGGGGGSLHSPVYLAGNTFLAPIQGGRVTVAGEGGVLGQNDLTGIFGRTPDLAIAYDIRGFPPAVSPVRAIQGAEKRKIDQSFCWNRLAAVISFH